MPFKIKININFEKIMKKITTILLYAAINFAFLQNNLANTPQSEQDSTTTGAPQPIELVEINFEIERVEKIFSKIENNLGPDDRFIEIDSNFQDYKIFLEKESEEFKAYNPYQLSKYFLESTYLSWEGFNLKLDEWQSEINNKIISVLDDLSNLDDIKQEWRLTLESEELANEPEEVKGRIREIIKKANDIRHELQKQKRQLILLEDDITDMTSYCNEITEEVTTLQQHLRDSLFIATSLPIWHVKITKSDYTPVMQRLNKAKHENAKTLRNYFETENLGTFWITIIMIISLFILIRYRFIKLNFNDTDPEYKDIVKILINYPILTIISLILMSFHLIFPYHPLLIGQIITLVLLINMWYILSVFVSPENKRLVFKIIILLLINNLEVIFWYFGNVARYYVLLESLIGILLLANYLKLTYWYNFKKSTTREKVILVLIMFAFLLYFISFFASLFGYINLSVLFVKAGIHITSITIILYGLYKISIVIIQALVCIWRKGRSTVLDNYWDIIQKRAIQIIGILAVYYWFFAFSVAFEVSRVIFSSITDFFVRERNIGTLNITIGGIFSLILILSGTFILTGFLKVLIEEILLKRSKLPRGVPAAISVTIRYFLIILGVMFALSSAGIELGKFSLLAGALGVGIGFGLQNIVNNFISGLILIYERPLQIGDTIEVENLLGQVNRIGIRSSNVKTYDGAEVIVPNGNLISNQLINWTLSDSKRRIEINVGVSYGSDPNIVIKLMEEVALENKNTIKDPAPRALFEEFGDSSLNFRLLFWVPYNIGLGTKSDVSVGIFNKFKENNIEIPFPQLDLHVKKGGNEIEK